jgi:hypothetical protein
MTAEALASELGGRPYGRGWRARCPSHPDKHPSLDIADRDGRILFIDRSGRCSQGEIIAELRRRGLWAPSSEKSPSPAVPMPSTFADQSDRPLPDPPPACCLSGPPHRCEHWREFNHEMIAVHMLSNLTEAAGEIIALYRTAQMPLDVPTLIRELEFAIPFGAIVPCEIYDSEVIAKAVMLIASEALEPQR